MYSKKQCEDIICAYINYSSLLIFSNCISARDLCSCLNVAKIEDLNEDFNNFVDNNEYRIDLIFAVVRDAYIDAHEVCDFIADDYIESFEQKIAEEMNKYNAILRNLQDPKLNCDTRQHTNDLSRYFMWLRDYKKNIDEPQLKIDNFDSEPDDVKYRELVNFFNTKYANCMKNIATIFQNNNGVGWNNSNILIKSMIINIGLGIMIDGMLVSNYIKNGRPKDMVLDTAMDMVRKQQNLDTIISFALNGESIASSVICKKFEDYLFGGNIRSSCHRRITSLQFVDDNNFLKSLNTILSPYLAFKYNTKNLVKMKAEWGIKTKDDKMTMIIAELKKNNEMILKTLLESSRVIGDSEKN